MWTEIGLGALVAGGFAVYAVTKPGRARRNAIREAVERAERTAAAAPNDSAKQVELAKVRLHVAGEPDAALEILRKVDAAEPHHWPGDDNPTKMLLGEAYVAKGDLAAAIEVFQSFVDQVGSYETGGDKERKWKLETHKVDAEQRIRLLKRGDTHVHQPEQWGDANQ